jgi:hypothetical protein
VEEFFEEVKSGKVKVKSKKRKWGSQSTGA